ncbi:uncharacterized protein LOC143611875 [Bidens hawaiensis]|uniref:uncharacterized protein LOC143611875 n=1 Tax=Bidens hawaiensis TaxID=980011 RepID=UPI00404A5C95
MHQVILSEPIGAIGYPDPEIEKSKGVTHKSDIYSFGVVLFELLCGRRAYIKNEADRFLARLAKYHYENETLLKIIHPDLRNQMSPYSLRIYSKAAYSCIHKERASRPNILILVDKLEKALKQALKFKPDFGKNLEHLKIQLHDIKLATGNFSDKYIHGSNNYYTWYTVEIGHFDNESTFSVEGKSKSELPKRHNTVVMKRFLPVDDEQEENLFFIELEMLTSVKHHNIINLLGFCVEGSDMMLVTEKFSNGELSYCLRKIQEISILTWEKRLKICIGIAHALTYLHFEMEDNKVMIHGNINLAKIVFNENLEAKIEDFELAVFLPPNQKDEFVYRKTYIESWYHVDPEYENTGKLKREIDVYSFGVVMFEIVCGRYAEDQIYLKESDNGLVDVARRNFCAGTLEDMIDTTLKEKNGIMSCFPNRRTNKDSLQTFLKIANQCVIETQDKRPTMKVVLKELEKALFFQNNKMNNPRISLEAIKVATQNFHNDNCIGGGGFGRVFKGKLQDGDELKTIVAKRLDTRFGQGEQQFWNELQILFEYKHENVIGLIGYCDEKDEKVIVYEYAPKGSLDRYLKDVSLTWVKRLIICIDVATALYFLHGGVGKQAKVIDRDIKIANILLNHEWKAKLGDFGLSLISPITHKTEYVIDYACGTPGYVDPLYEKSRFLTIESDVYSFGVVLFEILCGRSTFEIKKHKGHYLPEFIRNKFEEGKHDEVVFEQIREQIVPESLATFQEIAYQCLYHEREKRPTTKRVLTQLKKALEIQNMALTITKFSHLQIPLEVVVEATNNFHHDNIVEHGRFSITYKGRLLQSVRLMNIAAQKFDCKHVEADLEFLREISVLIDLKHTNLISIVGFCDVEDEKVIVTMYEANRCLGPHLSNPNLTWAQRLRICLGVARALSYLHYSKGRDYAIIHCNINSDTILLDDNWEAKLSSFETSIKRSVYNKDQVCPCEHIGTMGYTDPAIEKTGGVTHKSDIYSFGVVLFELLCGRKAFVQNQAKSFLAPLAKYHYENKTLQDIIFPDLQRNLMSPQSLLRYSNIAYSCLNQDRAHRPNIDYIAYELERALELQLQLENIEKKFEYLKISVADIKSATNDFSNTYRIASWFDYRYALYRAELKHFDKDNSLSKKGKNGEHSKVVIKRYPSGDMYFREEAFCKEIEMLSRVKHPNIVTLLGFCLEGSEMILVTENVSNGYLVYHLGNTDQMHIFTWEKRLKICIDVAHALKYLHYEMEDQKVIINRDITSYSIGLDENLGAKIVHFCLSVILPPNQNDEALYLNWIGRHAYIDPEYKKTNKLKRESDVYSFGVVLLEILCGRTAFDQIYKKESAKGLAHVARQSFSKGTLEDMIDPLIKGKTSESSFVLNRGPNRDSLRTFIQIAHQCVSESLNQRPTMKVVVKELEKALFLQKNNKDNQRIPLEDIKLATQNFHHDNYIGEEGFEKVYKGNLQNGDEFNTVAAKRLDTRLGQKETQFLSELQILWEYKHENVIGLVGYCDEQNEKVIVYEYASKRSLDRYLNDATLTWMKRLSICIDVASAMDFIHGKQAKVIHGDIKTAHILLRHDWKAKLAGFGLSLINPITHEIEYGIDYACGTPGYVDPLYKTSGFLTIESDIYSFGVVLFEILCGRSTFEIQKHKGHYLPEFIRNKFEEGKHDEVVFEQIREQIVPESLTTFQEIAYQCLHVEREKRPTAKEVLMQLKMALEFQVPTKPKVNDQSITDIEETISADYVDQPNLDTDESHKNNLLICLKAKRRR